MVEKDANIFYVFYTIVKQKANFSNIVLLSTNFFKTKYVFGIGVKF